MLVDPSTGESIFEYSADSLRMPASLLKIITAVALLDYVEPDFRFTTEILIGAEPQMPLMLVRFISLVNEIGINVALWSRIDI